MKKIAITALSATIIASSMPSLFAESNYYYEPTKDAIVAKQQASTAMRKEYYNKYIAKGYDVSALKPYLDGATTTESEFWEALKQMQNANEVASRKAYVEKLKSKGYDVSGFTESVIWDSGKFWEMVKMVESGKNMMTEFKKSEPVKTEVKKYVEEKKAEVVKKVEEKKTQVALKISAAQTERLTTMMKDRIAKIPADSRDATLVKLEASITKALDAARAKNARLLVARYEILLAVVQEEMNNVDDETLINSLFQ